MVFHNWLGNLFCAGYGVWNGTILRNGGYEIVSIKNGKHVKMRSDNENAN